MLEEEGFRLSHASTHPPSPPPPLHPPTPAPSHILRATYVLIYEITNQVIHVKYSATEIMPSSKVEKTLQVLA